MSDQPLCDRSSRTDVFSTRMGKRASSDSALEQPRMNPQRMLVDAADAEHPAIALAAPNRAPHLIGQGLKGDLFVGLRQRAAMAPLGPSLLHRLEKAAIAGS